MSTRSLHTPSRSYLLKDAQVFASEVERLKTQAQMFFALEQKCLVDLHFPAPSRILELGCGNGYYLSLWSQAFPLARCAGIDRNSRLLELAHKELPQAQWVEGDLLDQEGLSRLLAHFKPDTVLLRFVLQHLNSEECSGLLLFLAAKCNELGFRLLLIDPDDSAIGLQPDSPPLRAAIEGVMRKQSQNGGDRRRGAQLTQLCREGGFLNLSSGLIDAGTRGVGWKGIRDIWVPLWRQGLAEEDQYHPIREWLENAESGLFPAEISIPIHVTIAQAASEGVGKLSGT